MKQKFGMEEQKLPSEFALWLACTILLFLSSTDYRHLYFVVLAFSARQENILSPPPAAGTNKNAHENCFSSLYLYLSKGCVLRHRQVAEYSSEDDK